MEKFLFNTCNFDHNNGQTPVAPTFSETEMEQIKNDSFALGKAAGLRSALETREHMVAQKIAQISATLIALDEKEEARDTAKYAGAIDLALQMIDALFPFLGQACAKSHARQFILDTLATKKNHPRVTLFLPEDQALLDDITTLMKKNDLSDKVNITVNPNLATTDCKIDWDDGHASLIYTDLLARLRTACETAIEQLRAEGK